MLVATSFLSSHFVCVYVSFILYRMLAHKGTGLVFNIFVFNSYNRAFPEGHTQQIFVYKNITVFFSSTPKNFSIISLSMNSLHILILWQNFFISFQIHS